MIKAEQYDWYEIVVRHRITGNRFVIMRLIEVSETEALEKAAYKLTKGLSIAKILLIRVLVNIKARKMVPHELLGVNLNDPVEMEKFARPNKTKFLA